MAEAGGIRLDSYLRDRGPLPPGKAARIAAELLARIGEVAGSEEFRSFSGISPGRILISPTGKVILLDPPDEFPTAFSRPAYASPEEIRGAPFDERSAIYSLGCMLFEILTGRPPFPGDSPQGILDAQLAQPAPEVRDIRPEVPGELSQAVSRFLQKDPGLRPATAAEALQAIRSAMGLPTVAPAPAPAAPASPSVPPELLEIEMDEVQSVQPPPRAVIQRTVAASAFRPAPAQRKPPAPGSAAARTPAPAARPVRPRVLGAGPVRKKSAQPVGTAWSPRENLPEPHQSWMYCWIGLAGGILLSLIVFISRAGSSSSSQDEMSKAERDQISARRDSFKKSIDADNRLAEAQYDGLNVRVSDAERIAAIRPIIDKYPHTPAAMKMAQTLSDLQARADEAAANAAERKSAASVLEGSTPPGGGETPAPETPPADPAKDSGGKKDGLKAPDDIGTEPGGDDGKSDL